MPADYKIVEGGLGYCVRFWCWICHCPRLHTMQTEELGRCVVCGTKQWAPMGDID